ncbi:hypothetical protein EG346_16955 [Chryseobacterium carnipullorum]|uniref:Uncharacterized protein n=1 Tax=Chryseobacterium carnipullorum TaxID=1124835 RepID=A0A376DU57_CHRCU|nr:hypothetical protein [Chryseobacterium carnipullorum]AZA49764.1 hypothetical protein EG346_16955 [Chryseobacterium carnipullorum]AZA64655.1 hypothetical protein EG345_07980 [Chryseobacterium carnipullorum]STC95635.1 Uncharacterised protein [Chryseobacterium carnipullorum]
MKKLFSIGVLTLVMLTSCQNSNDEITSKPEVSNLKASKVPEGKDPKYFFEIDTEKRELKYGGKVLGPVEDKVLEAEVQLSVTGQTTGRFLSLKPHFWLFIASNNNL